MHPNTRRAAILAAASLLLAMSNPVRADGRNWNRAYDAAIAGAGFAAGDAIGSAAVGGQGGYDGGAPTGSYRGPGPANRPCYDRRPVYDAEGTLIGYRGVQLC